jgi:purine-binding chemotaxis protein CheW
MAIASSVADASGITALSALAVRLGEVEYGIKILKVQEIRGYDTVTRIANAPNFIKGVINLLPIRSGRRRKWAPRSIPTT